MLQPRRLDQIDDAADEVRTLLIAIRGLRMMALAARPGEALPYEDLEGILGLMEHKAESARDHLEGE